MKTALITGITGQDGSYLAELLLEKGYQVWGVTRRSSTFNGERIAHILDKIHVIEADIDDVSSLIRALQQSKPDEVYHLAAMSFVKASWDEPIATAHFTALGTLNLLEAIRIINPSIRFYQASSSEMFGKVRESPQHELTPFHPRSPYGVSKTFAHYTTLNYRESYGIFACSGILFNHESPRRGFEFVTRKITDSVAKIKLGLAKELVLGNLDARRDWGFAGDYVKAMWLMLQRQSPEDFVIGTGTSHSVKEFVTEAFRHVGITEWQIYVKEDPALLRPAEVDSLLADPSKAQQKLGWEPRVTFKELVVMMVEADLQRLKKK